MLNKSKYRELCRNESSISIFSRDWWMDSVCGSENWDVLLMESGGEIVAAIPYYMVKWHGLKYVKQPPLTQKNGIWIRYPGVQNCQCKLSFEKEVMGNLIEQMETLNICYYDQGFDYNITNWLPFYWKGYKQTTMYTYVVEDLTNLDRVFSNFDDSKRRNIKKSQKLVNVNTDLPAREFYENHRMNLAKRGREISYDLDLFVNVYDAVYQNDSGKAFYAVDSCGNIHAALFIVWDEISAYNLINTTDPDFRNSGASSLLVQEAIRYVSTKTTRFDFEGSMAESIENSYRRFGTVQKPYFNIRKEFKTNFRWSILKKLAYGKYKVKEVFQRTGGLK
jgi:hypothetical protein